MQPRQGNGAWDWDLMSIDSQQSRAAYPAIVWDGPGTTLQAWNGLIAYALHTVTPHSAEEAIARLDAAGLGANHTTTSGRRDYRQLRDDGRTSSALIRIEPTPDGTLVQAVAWIEPRLIDTTYMVTPDDGQRVIDIIRQIGAALDTPTEHLPEEAPAQLPALVFGQNMALSVRSPWVRRILTFGLVFIAIHLVAAALIGAPAEVLIVSTGVLVFAVWKLRSTRTGVGSDAFAHLRGGDTTS